MKDIGSAFTFPFKDPNWVTKFLLGAMFMLLCFVLIGIPVLYGYFVELIQRVRRREQYPLPEWKDVGVKFVVGFKYLVVTFVYALPLFIVLIPLIFFIIFTTVVQDSEFVSIMGSAATLAIMFFIILPYSLIITVLTPVISIRYAERESMGDALNLSEVFSLFKRYWQDVLIAALIGIGVQLLATFGLILFFVGILFTHFYAHLITFHLYGQIAENTQPASTLASPQYTS